MCWCHQRLSDRESFSTWSAHFHVLSVLHSLEDEFTSEVFLVAVYQLGKLGQQGVGGCGTCLVFLLSGRRPRKPFKGDTWSDQPGIFSRLPTDETGGQSWVNQASRLPRPTKPYKGTCASQVFLVISKTLHFGKILNCSSSTCCHCRCSSSTRCRCARLENSRLKLSWGMRALT